MEVATIGLVPSDRLRSTAPPPRQAASPSVSAPEEPELGLFPLRLTVARGSLGMELYEPIGLGPFEITGLALTLPGLKFPLDLSGGVTQFRHRRGMLQHLRFKTSTESLAALVAPHAVRVLGELERPVSVWFRPTGICLGVVSGSRALAFDVLWAPEGQRARAVVTNARGAGLGAPALGFALRILDGALAGVATRRGRVVFIDRAPARMVSALLPSFGARAPAVTGVGFGSLTVEASELLVELDSEATIGALSVETARALEAAHLAQDADELLVTGDLDAARGSYLEALERAPKHPDLALAVAEIDLCVGGRAEAALGLLVDTTQATRAGLAGAELLARVGDITGSREATAATAVSEPFAPVAALGWAQLAEFEPSALDRLDALDRACARAPSLRHLRWKRLQVRVERRDWSGALADAQHLEAASQGARARYEVCLRAARLLSEAGQRAGAGRLFERALRYLPDDPIATAGLARAFMESNRPLRAAALLERAVGLSERQGGLDAAALIDLAKVLARQMKDLPSAISRLRQVPAASPQILEARALEGRYRARLGDLSGASLAYAHMREAIELSEQSEPRAKHWLMEAARFEEDSQRDVLAAERHLAQALRIAPHDDALGQRYRQVAKLVADRRRDGTDADEE